ncbi:MAG: hypothetical protein JNK82_38175, partial [Myxococcaceae bacterium]|nr:hypothetical protein [Myxococcaceae bacterium]
MTPVVLLLLSSLLNPLHQADVVQVTGWSADETKFSVRAFELEEGDGLPECKGYIDHQGKAFTGKLYIAAYDKGEMVKTWLIQNYPDCTPPETAKKYLSEAKAKLAELGIDLNATGTQVPCAKSCDL